MRSVNICWQFLFSFYFVRLIDLIKPIIESIVFCHVKSFAIANAQAYIRLNLIQIYEQCTCNFIQWRRRMEVWKKEQQTEKNSIPAKRRETFLIRILFLLLDSLMTCQSLNWGKKRKETKIQNKKSKFTKRNRAECIVRATVVVAI